MVVITKSKKFESRFKFGMMPILSGVLLAIFAGSASMALAQGQAATKLPMIRQVGIIPVQWETVDDTRGGLAEVRPQIDGAFPKAVHQSSRFSLINDDLVASEWSTPDGRAGLRKQYELDAYASFSVVVKPDTVMMVARLLSPGLENYLVESETYSRSQVAAASEAAAYQMVQSLVFKMFNRIPIDVSVTSVQGKYVTLAGGSKQNIRVGDKIQLVRVVVASRHPANGAWAGFQTTHLGDAKIIDADAKTSVALLLSLAREDALQVGDGAKNPAIAGRAKFQNENRPRQYIDPAGSTIIVPPLYASDAKPNDKIEPIKEGETTEPGAEKARDDEDSDLLNALSKRMAYVRGTFGPKFWHASGQGAADAKLPLWIINHVDAVVGKHINQNVTAEYGAGLDFGPTKQGGNFTGLGLQANAFYHKAITGVDIKNFHWRAGGEGSFNTMAVSKATYGGGDVIGLGGFGGVGGSGEVAERAVGWNTDLHLYPIALGRLGARGSKSNIKSTFGYLLDLGAHLEAKPREIEWGATFRLASQVYLLSGSKEIDTSEMSLMATANYKF